MPTSVYISVPLHQVQSSPSLCPYRPRAIVLSISVTQKKKKNETARSLLPKRKNRHSLLVNNSALGFSILDILLPLGDAPPDLFLSGLSTTLNLLPDLLFSPFSALLGSFTSFSPRSLFADLTLSFIFRDSLVLDRV